MKKVLIIHVQDKVKKDDSTTSSDKSNQIINYIRREKPIHHSNNRDVHNSDLGFCTPGPTQFNSIQFNPLRA